MIIASFDVKKLDKTKFVPGKNGALYCDLILIESPDNEYGNSHFVKQGVSKEDREAGVQMPILGNAKTLRSGKSGREQARNMPSKRQADTDGPDASPLPF